MTDPPKNPDFLVKPPLPPPPRRDGELETRMAANTTAMLRTALERVLGDLRRHYATYLNAVSPRPWTPRATRSAPLVRTALPRQPPNTRRSCGMLSSSCRLRRLQLGSGGSPPIWTRPLPLEGRLLLRCKPSWPVPVPSSLGPTP